MLAERQGCDGLLLAATPDGLLCPTHLAELDLHEDVVLSPTAPLCTPGVLGSVGARAAGRGPPVTCEANSCPGKKERGQADSGNRFPLVPPLREGLSPGAGDPLLGGRRGKEGGRTKASEVRSGSGLPGAQGQGWTPAQALPPGRVGPVVTAATSMFSSSPVTGVGAKVSAPIQVPDKGDLTQHHSGAGHWEVGGCPEQVRAAQRP